MKTWKQGVLGKIELGRGNTFFTKCLKYPLLKIAASYDIINADLSDELLYIFSDLEILREITYICDSKLTKEEKELGQAFDMEYIQGTSIIGKIKNNSTERYGKIKGVSDQGLIDMKKLNMLMMGNRKRSK